jgi:hypothetical protein
MSPGRGTRTKLNTEDGGRALRNAVSNNSVTSVRERTIPTERPPHVGAVSANFCGQRGVAWSARRIPYGHSLYFLDRTLFLIKKVKTEIYILVYVCKTSLIVLVFMCHMSS